MGSQRNSSDVNLDEQVETAELSELVSNEDSATVASHRVISSGTANFSLTLQGSDVVPGPFDILCGRGRAIQGELPSLGQVTQKANRCIQALSLKPRSNFPAHTGNILLLKLVNMHKERYNQARRLEKRKIAEEIVLALKAQQSRFLKKCETSVQEAWYEVTGDEAIDKVSHSLRRKK